MKSKIFALIAVTLFSLSSFAQMQSINANNNQQQTNNGKKTLDLSDLNLKGGGAEANPYLLTYPEVIQKIYLHYLISVHKEVAIY